MRVSAFGHETFAILPLLNRYNGKTKVTFLLEGYWNILQNNQATCKSGNQEVKKLSATRPTHISSLPWLVGLGLSLSLCSPPFPSLYLFIFLSYSFFLLSFSSPRKPTLASLAHEAWHVSTHNYWAHYILKFQPNTIHAQSKKKILRKRVH